MVAHHACHRPAAVIGDIHGRSDLLGRLLERLPGREIFVVGDVGDRGPDTRGVIDRLIAAGAAGVRGNHEEWLIGWLSGEPLDPFALNPRMGGAATLASYGVDTRDPARIDAQRHRVPPEHAAWLRALPVALRLEVLGEGWWLIHAGIPSTVPLSGLRPGEVVPHLAARHADALLWAKNDPEEMLPVDLPVIMGHVPLAAPIRRLHGAGAARSGVIALDTGCGRGGPLTALLLPEARCVSIG